jgi:hypothetical protein
MAQVDDLSADLKEMRLITQEKEVDEARRT